MKILAKPTFLALSFLGVVGFLFQATAQPVVSQHPVSFTDPNKEIYRVEKIYDKESATWYFLTTIHHKDANGEIIKLRHAVSEEPLGETVRAFAERTGSILAFNASMGKMGKSPSGDEIRDPRGTQIVDGEILQERSTNRYILGVKADNELIAYRPGTAAKNILQDGANDALTAFIPLIEDSKPVDEEIFAVGPRNYREKHPRQIIAQMKNLDVLFLSCGGRGYGGEGMSPQEVIRILMDRGAKFAFMLDGGGSVSTVVEGQLMTEKIDGRGTRERMRPNFLYVSKK